MTAVEERGKFIKLEVNEVAARKGEIVYYPGGGGGGGGRRADYRGERETRIRN